MHDDNFFTNIFFKNYNIRYLAKQLKYLEKRIALFLLNFFIDVYQNLGKLKIILQSKSKLYELSILKI